MPVGAHGSQGALQRLGQQHHAGPAAERAVVHALVHTVAEVAQRPQAHVHLLRFECAPRHAERKVRREQFREQREDVEAHQ
jgi:hypothetical protein